MSLVNPSNKIATSGSIKDAVERFLKEIIEDDFQPKNIRIDKSKDEMVSILRNIYT